MPNNFAFTLQRLIKSIPYCSLCASEIFQGDFLAFLSDKRQSLTAAWALLLGTYCCTLAIDVLKCVHLLTYLAENS